MIRPGRLLSPAWTNFRQPHANSRIRRCAIVRAAARVRALTPPDAAFGLMIAT